jgi:hypothetical protein
MIGSMPGYSIPCAPTRLRAPYFLYQLSDERPLITNIWFGEFIWKQAQVLLIGAIFAPGKRAFTSVYDFRSLGPHRFLQGIAKQALKVLNLYASDE